jgi:C4-dicarboxylate transporter
MATMVTFFPDVCSAQAGMSLTGAVAVCAKATEGTEYSASPS